MAETITLRAYLNNLNDMLERGAVAEVVSHCRYILQHFPQNIDTYRLLAQALLQRGHNEGVSTFFDQAAEVFQRVLSVIPNDYVAHYGLSAIREQDGELDRAIWHMERAYEQLPGNQVLQDALRKLYAKRDGEQNAPKKIQLTRGALARQYVTGQLYDQALIELRNALQHDASRVDLEVMLAETLWESQHPVEAGEAAVRILKKLPNCLAANRILTRLWLENERPADAQRFLDRLEAIDPYLAVDVLQPNTEVYDTITLDWLDYNAQAQAALSQETPDWVEELGGIEMGNVFSLDEPISTDADEFDEESPETMQFDSGWSAEDTSVDAEVPAWFADIGGDDDQAPANFGQVQDTPASPAAPPDWFAESAGWESEAESEPTDGDAPIEADWLLDDDDANATGDDEEPKADDFTAMFDDMQANMPLESEVSETDIGITADWLNDDADEMGDFSAMFEPDTEADQPEESSGEPAEAGWLSDDAEELPDFAAMFELNDDTDDQADEPSNEMTDFATLFGSDADTNDQDEQLAKDVKELPDFAATFDAAAKADQEEPVDEMIDFGAMFETDDDTDEQDEELADEAPDWSVSELSDEVSDFAAMFEAVAATDQAEEPADETTDAAEWVASELTDEETAFAAMFETDDETDDQDEELADEAPDWSVSERTDEATDFAAMFDAAAETDEQDEALAEDAPEWLSKPTEEEIDFAAMFETDDETNDQAGQPAEDTPKWLSKPAEDVTAFAAMFDADDDTDDQPEEPAEDADEMTDFAAMFDADNDTDEQDEEPFDEESAFAAMFEADDETDDQAEDSSDEATDWSISEPSDEETAFATMFDANDDADEQDEEPSDEESAFAAMFEAGDETDAQAEEPSDEATDWSVSEPVDEETAFAAMFEADTAMAQAEEPAEDTEEMTDFAAMFDAASATDQDEEPSDEATDWSVSEPVDEETAFAAMFEADTAMTQADELVEDTEEMTDFAAMFDTASVTDQDEEPADEALDWSVSDADEITEFAAMFEVNTETESAEELFGDDITEEEMPTSDWMASSEATDEMDDSASDEAADWVQGVSEESQLEADSAADWLQGVMGTDHEPDTWLTDADEMSEADSFEASQAEMPVPSETEFASDAAEDWLMPTEVREEDFELESELTEAETLDSEADESDQPDDAMFPVAEALLDSDETDQDVALDWLQTSPDASDDWSGSEVEDTVESAVSDDWATQTGEWLQAIPDLELESVPGEEGDALLLDADDESAFAAELLEHEAADQLEELLDQDETDEDEDVRDMPYDPFEGGRADHVPEYESATETGILQPDESPDWMLALTGDLSPEMVDTTATDQDQDETDDRVQESLLSALGFEIEAEDESISDEEMLADDSDEPEAEYDEVEESEVEEQPFDLDQLAPPAEEEGAMPDWLVAITGTAQLGDEIDFDVTDDEVDQLESELDWLTPMGDASDQLDDTFDDDKILAALEPIEESPETSEPDDTALDATASLEDMFALPAEAAIEMNLDDDSDGPFADFDFDEMIAESAEMVESDAAVETAVETAIETPIEEPSDDMFAEFDFDSAPEVAQLDDLAHTKDETGQTETSMTFDFDDEASDTPSSGGFSFGDITPRWLRKPKDALEDDETD